MLAALLAAFLACACPCPKPNPYATAPALAKPNPFELHADPFEPRPKVNPFTHEA